MRSSLDTPFGSLLVMPAFGDGGVGVKLVTVTPGNPDRELPLIGAVYVLFDGATQTPEAIAAAKTVGAADLARCADLGAAFAGGLALGVF